MKLKLHLLCAASLLVAASAHATLTNFFVPTFRGQASTEYALWENFSVAYNGGNAPDQAGSTGNGTITQTTPGPGTEGSLGPFVIGGFGNIYSPDSVNTFRLDDTTPFTLGRVVFQVRNSTGTTPFDFESVRLQYDNGNGAQSIYASRQDLGGNASAWDWNVSGLNISSYSIFFNASGTSLSLDAVALDTQAVPEPSTWALVGMGVAGILTLRRRRKV